MILRVSQLSFLLGVMLLCGCIGESVLIENTSKSERPQYGNIYDSDGLSSSASNLLANLMLRDLYAQDPTAVIIALEERYRDEPTEELLIALANLSWHTGYKASDSDANFAASAYASTLLYAYYYLIRNDNPKADPYNTDRFVVMRLYNQAQTELFAYLKAQNLLLKDAYELVTLSGKKMVFDKAIFDLPKDTVATSKNLFLCADYRTKNLFHQSYRFGLGTPLTLTIEDKITGDDIHTGKSLPITLVTHIHRSGKKYTAKMHYINVLQSETVALKESIEFPLELDFSTPLAFLTQKQPLYNFLEYTFNPASTKEMQGLYFLQPYDPNRIPVLFVHGLLSNPRTWIQMVNTLQNDPIIRKHYQFWGYSYSSGNPILISAHQFRDDLDNIMKKLHAENPKNKQLDRMVVVGHSMGGLLSKTLRINSDGANINKQLDIPWEQLIKELDSEELTLMQNLLMMTPKDYVKRIVFIAVPHRGASLATSLIGKIGAYLITVPVNLAQKTLDLKSNILQFLTKNNRGNIDIVLQHNGIIDLKPNNQILMFLNNSPFDKSIPYHSIIGNNKEANVPSGTDGIVPYSSSHLDDAESELVVKSGHSAHSQPLAIMEMRRILLEHLQGFEDTRREIIKEDFLAQ